MRKASLAVAALLILGIFALPNVPKAHAITNATGIGVINNTMVWDHTPIYAQGRYWLFYAGYNQTGSVHGFRYITSNDTIHWKNSLQAIATPFSLANGEAVWNVGSSVWIVTTDSVDGNGFYLRYGTLNTDGTITPITDSTLHSTTNNYGGPTISTIIANGLWWVAIPTFNSTASQTHLEVWTSSNNGGTWSKVSDFTTYEWDPELAQLADGHVALVSEDGDTTLDVAVRITSNNGATWTSPVATSLSYGSTYSAVSIGNSVQISGSHSNTIQTLSYAEGGGSWSSPINVGSVASNVGTSITQLSTGAGIFFHNTSVSYAVYEVHSFNLSTWTAPVIINPGQNASGRFAASYKANPFTEFGDWVGSTAGVGNLYFSYLAVGAPNETVVIPCTFYQLQCWLYPLFFVSTYFIIICGIAAKSGVEQEALKTLALESLTIGSMLAVIVGLLNIMIPLLLVVIHTVRVLRA